MILLENPDLDPHLGLKTYQVTAIRAFTTLHV